MQCILEISLKKIKSNWKKINIYSNFKASAVVKANAYGFGLEEVGLALSKSGCNFFYVAQNVRNTFFCFSWNALSR